jgi:hypothetical protein
MRTSLDCIPCFARQALEAARFVCRDEAVAETVLREVLAEAARMDLAQSPPVLAQWIHRRLREISGHQDPYARAKQRFNRLALSMLPDLRRQIELAADPFALAVRLSIAGNVIDLGVDGLLEEEYARGCLDRTLDEPFRGSIDSFARAVQAAETILFLADNVGEIVFDRLLIEQMGPGKVIVAVRGGPILNDATVPDARAAGLTELVEVIDNGSDAPGTLLEDCSDAFGRQFDRADLIVAKGMGNFETLSDVPANIYFLLKVKCPVIASRASAPVGTHLLTRSQTQAPNPESCHARV